MLEFSLQQADARHRALLTRAFVRRCLVAALERPAELTVRIVDAYGRWDAERQANPEPPRQHRPKERR